MPAMSKYFLVLIFYTCTYSSWKKLDSKSAECKAQVAQYWKWEGKDAQGRDFNQGKILK